MKPSSRSRSRGQKRRSVLPREAVGARALLVSGIAFFAAFDPNLIVLAGPLVAVLVLLFGRPLNIKMDWTVHLAGLFIFWAFLSYAWANNPDNALFSAAHFASVIVLFLGIRDTLQVPHPAGPMRAIATGYLLGCIAAVAQLVWMNRDSLGADRLALGELNQNYLGYSLAVGFAVIALLWKMRPYGRAIFRSRPRLLAAGAVLVLGIELSGTRGAYLGLICLLAWLAACAVTKRPPLTLVVLALATSSVIVVFGFLDQWSLQFESGERATGNWSGRLIIWPLARDLWAENPWIGVGSGGLHMENYLGIGAHNVFLQIGTGLGIIGVVLYVGIFASSLWTQRQGSHTRAYLIGAYLAATAPAYMSGHWESAPAGWIVLALFSSIHFEGRRKNWAKEAAVRPRPRKFHAYSKARNFPRPPASTSGVVRPV